MMEDEVVRRRGWMTRGLFLVLDGVNVSALALMAVVSRQPGRAALVDPLTVAMAAASLIALLRFRLHSAWIAFSPRVRVLRAWLQLRASASSALPFHGQPPS
jgi:hypothetical protein